MTETEKLFKLNPTQSAKIIKFFETKSAGGGGCPFCKSRDFIAEQKIVYMQLDPNGTAVAPFVMLICKNCGHTSLFSAQYMGLSPEETGLKGMKHE